jgi:NAD(P)H-nitrite reductase large subunit
VNYIIIGNSASGVAAIEAIRKYDEKSQVTVISDESYTSYSRPLISYLLGKKVTPKMMPYREINFYKDNQVKLVLNSKITKLDLSKKEVVLMDKQKIHFNKLLIAIGGKPINLRIPGSELNGIFTFSKLDDVGEIERYIKTNKVKKAVVVGGGLIGLKTTEALIELKIKVTIVELADRILSSSLDKKASNIIEEALKKKDCKLITNNSIKKIKEKNNKKKEVILKNQKRISTDLIIVAIGVKPNMELVKNTLININKGILVDKFMQTNVKNVYAAGDCCEAKDLISMKSRPITIWPVAVQQGKIAGFNMAGVKREYQGSFIMNSIELCAIPIISVGESCSNKDDCQILEHFDCKKTIYKKIVLKNNKIIGGIFVNNIERAGLYTGLIRNKIDILNFKEHLLEEEFGLINLPKFYRKNIL